MSGWLAVVVVFAVLAACGAGLLALLGIARSARELLRTAALAPLAGAAWVGIAGATLATLGPRLGLAALAVLTAATCAAGALRLRSHSARPSAPAPRRATVPEWALAAAAGGMAAAVVLVASVESHDKPLAEYDGWAMWGMKARALATLGSADPAVFASGAYSRLHLEYPLLLPTLSSLPLQLADGYTSPTVVLFCFALGVAGLLAIGGVLLGRVRAFVVLPFVAAVATIPAFFLQLQTGYADVPLALFVATGVAAAARWLSNRDAAWLALATLFLAAGVLTKNEGLLFAFAAYVPLVVLASGRRAQVLLSAAAVLVVYAPWRVSVAVHDLGSPDYDLSASFNLPWVAGRLDRAPVAARELVEVAADPERSALALALAALAVAIALVRGRRSLAAFAAGFALLSLAGLSWIYVLTPHELQFFLSTNADRIVVAPLVALVAVAPLLVADAGSEERA